LIPPFLFSFAYTERSKPLAHLVECLVDAKVTEVMIDSGAFTAHRQGREVDLKAYCAYVKRLQDEPAVWGCVQLDKINDSPTTRRSLQTMLDAGCRPMPVLTTDMKIEEAAGLDKPCGKLCVAGALGQWEGHDDWILSRYRRVARELPGAKLHGLAYVRWPTMFDASLASVDSSSHNTGGVYGSITSFDARTGISTIAGASSKPQGRKRIVAFGKRCGVGAELALRSTRGTDCITWASTGLSSALLARHSRRRGLLVFQAVSAASNIAQIILAAKHAKRDGSGLRYLAYKADMERLVSLDWRKRNELMVQIAGELQDHEVLDRLQGRSRGIPQLAGGA